MVDRKALAYLEKHAPSYLELPKDVSSSENLRGNTSHAFVLDVPPETAGYDWKWRKDRPQACPPTGLGRKFWN